MRICIPSLGVDNMFTLFVSQPDLLSAREAFVDFVAVDLPIRKSRALVYY